MHHNVMGGSYGCRICGTSHTSAIRHSKVSQLQRVQMLLEEIEFFASVIALRSYDRVQIVAMMTNLRNGLGIPDQKIYVLRNYPNPSLWGGRSSEEYKARLREYEEEVSKNIAMKSKIDAKAKKEAELFFVFLKENAYTTNFQEQKLSEFKKRVMSLFS